MRPLNFFSGASTGTFSCLKVAMMLLLEASMVGSPAAVATKAAVTAIVQIHGELRLIGGSLGPKLKAPRGRRMVACVASRAVPGEHALERRIAIKKVMLQRGGRVQQHHRQQRPCQESVHLDQHI